MSRYSYDSRSVAAAVAAALTACYPAVSPAQEGEQGAGKADASAVQEITVTGSRIVRRDLEAASPLVTVEDQAFEQNSTLAVESVLNKLPQYVPANTQFNTSDVFPSATSTPGISTISLRGLGANRTLVLVDGHRAQPANSTLVIDTNSIPSAALESVEIITGGASAVYGADALAGVTNFKLKSKFEGFDLQARSGITERGDGQENRLSMLLGSSLADGRGHAMLGLEYTKREEVLASDRDFFTRALKDSRTNGTSVARMNRFQYEASTTTGLPSQAAANALFPQRPAGYAVPRNTNFLFNDDGSLFKQELQGLGFAGDIVNDPRYKIAPNGQLIENNFDLRYSSPMDRYSLFGKADFNVSEKVQAFATVNFVNTTNRQVLQPTGAVGGFGATIPYGSDIYGPSLLPNGDTAPEYLPGGAYGLNCPAKGGCTQSQAFPVSPQLASLLNSRGPNATSNSTTPVSYDPVTGQPVIISGADASWALGGTLNFLPTRQVENTTNLYQLLAGFRGSLGISDWTWEAYASHGETRTDLDYIGFASLRRFQAIAQAPNFGKGYSATAAGTTSITCTSGLPIFSQFEVSQDCIDAITASYTDRTRLSQNIYEATAQGRLFDLPMGELRGALGVTYRKNEFQYLPDATREVNSIIDIPIGTFGQANVIGETTVREVYGELLVPLLKDKFLARSLELELGYRYSDYDITGSVPTWKALFTWSPVNNVRFRGGYQLANRAPNINELFLDASSQALTMRGPEYCRADTREPTGNTPSNPNRAAVQALCQALIGNTTSEFSADPNNYLGGRADGVILQVSSGNRNLASEKGRTYTFGAVLTSPFESPALSNASLSLDYYHVKITDAIATVSAQSTFDLCFNRDGTSNPNYSIDDPNGICRNIIRDEQTGAALQVLSQYENLGIIQTSGLDLSFDWRSQMSDLGLERVPGGVSLNLSVTKLFSYKAQEFKTAPALENKGTLGVAAPGRGTLFDWRSNMTLRYGLNSWNVGLNWQHLPSIRSNAYVTDHLTPIQGAESYDMFSLTGDWNISDTLAVSGGIDNLFDKEPPPIGAGQIQTIGASSGGGQTVLDGAANFSQAGFYDVLGRRYFLNVKLRF